MKLAVDVYYYNDKAKVVGLMFENWSDVVPTQIVYTIVNNVEPYESGNFYKRELPCIMELMTKINNNIFNEIIIDGYVYLDNTLSPGLGKHVYDKMQCKHPVIGVAKTPYYHNKKIAVQVLRGQSKNPLYITSVGIESEVAAKNISSMAGNSRIPILLKLLDKYTKLDNTLMIDEIMLQTGSSDCNDQINSHKF